MKFIFVHSKSCAPVSAVAFSYVTFVVNISSVLSLSDQTQTWELLKDMRSQEYSVIR